ncbi:MAG: hypothetical protein ACLQIK_18900 [Mycobacterium sp.]|uniref:hypothetical protein n=1 Tax=Mycobacterium sp. TaxID=1785 RepID=UPI003F943DDC
MGKYTQIDGQAQESERNDFGQPGQRRHVERAAHMDEEAFDARLLQQRRNAVGVADRWQLFDHFRDPAGFRGQRGKRRWEGPRDGRRCWGWDERWD